MGRARAGQLVPFCEEILGGEGGGERPLLDLAGWCLVAVIDSF